MLETIINTTTDALYSYVLIILLLLGGLYFTLSQVLFVGKEPHIWYDDFVSGMRISPALP